MFNKLFFLVSISLFLVACESSTAVSDSSEVKEVTNVEAMTTEKMKDTASASKADQLLIKALEAHGGAERYDQAQYEFVFRKKTYTFKNDGPNYIYTSTITKDGSMTVDRLENSDFSRSIDGNIQALTDKQITGYTGSLNSVIYFATLPTKLRDKAVNLSIDGKSTVKGQAYELLRVNFDEEGGGTDHDDNFLYWINQETGRIDYLAYDYRVDGGGVRFRSAYNPRVVGGILFQDYVNYKAPVGTALNELSTLYEANELKELSRIETEDVRVIE